MRPAVVAPLTLLLALGLLLVSGCASQSALSRADYAPAAPVVPEPRTTINGSIYHASTNRFLFEDLKARRVGDLITVILQEKTNAAKTATTTTSKSSNTSVPSPTLFGAPATFGGKEFLNNSFNSSSDFAGQGDSTQSNSLSGNITVTVAEVLPNGNLVIRGEKLLTLNQGSEVVRISGLVRSADVTPENTVISTQIANARITYGGNGIVADSNRAGWLSRFFHSAIWPF